MRTQLLQRIFLGFSITTFPLLLAFHDGKDDPPTQNATETDTRSWKVGDTVWKPVPNWGQHEDLAIGNTHGTVAVAPDGSVLYNTDGGHGILVHNPGGEPKGNLAGNFSGIHGMHLRNEDGKTFIYGAHLPGKQIVKLRLDGTHVWTIGVPMESGKYDGDPNSYNPTAIAVAPDGRIYVADGYGRNWIHVFGPDLTYTSSFGGRGTQEGAFRTCHGLALDTSGDEPLLVVCDRENRRLQRFTLDGEFVDVPAKGLRRPCSIAFWDGPNGERLAAVAELEGRVTLFDGEWNKLGHVGDNSDTSQRAKNGIPKDKWTTGVTTAPHGLVFDRDGNLYVQDWNAHGRVHKFMRTPANGQ